MTVSARHYRQCDRCVMDTSDPEIVFYDDGTCNHCRNFIQTRMPFRLLGAAGEQEFDRIVDTLKSAGRGRPYDCIMGMSGGVDSSYMAMLLVERGIRPLAVHMDNGWDTRESVVNLHRVTTALGMDYRAFVLDWDEFRDVQLAFLKASVPDAELPTDVAIPAILHHCAVTYGVKYIVSAGVIATEGILPRSWQYDPKDLKYLNSIHGRFGTRPRRTMPIFDYKREGYYKVVRGIRMAYPLNCFEFDQQAATDVLIERFGFQPYAEKHHESRYTRFVQSYYMFRKFGIDYRRARFSSEICCDMRSRANALCELETRPHWELITSDLPYIAKKLGITPDELDGILSRPPKWFWDYPNGAKKLSFVYDTYRRLAGKEKLANF